MSEDFLTNLDVPVELPQVAEYSYPEGDYSEKAQDVEYRLNAAIASMQLQLASLHMRKRELDRVIGDLENRLGDVT